MVDFECSSSKPNYKDWDFKAAAKGFIGSSDFSSSSSSSVLGDELVSSESAETTDEEDDYIAELTRQMTHYMLQDDHDKANISSQKNQEVRIKTVSPLLEVLCLNLPLSISIVLKICIRLIN